MKRVFIALVMIAISFAVPPTPGSAATRHNGACVKFGGTIAMVRYVGVKCYLDKAPGDYVIRMSVKERDNPVLYRKLLRVRSGRVRCTLTEGPTSVTNGMVVTRYKLSNC